MKKKYYEFNSAQTQIKYLLSFSLHSQTASVPFYAVVKEKLDFDVLRKAIDIEAERNDSLKVRYKGKLSGYKQYFVTEARKFSDKIAFADFTGKTEEDEIAYLKKDASEKLDFKNGETARFILFRSHDGGSGIYVNAFHMAFDAAGVCIMLLDILSVYDALANGKELPPPLSSFENKLVEEKEYLKTDGYKRQKEILENVYARSGKPFLASPAGIEKLKKLREKKKDPEINTYNLFNPLKDKSEYLTLEVPHELVSKMRVYGKESRTPIQNLFQIGYRVYCSAVNERASSVMMTTICDRRKTRSDRNMGGNIMNSAGYHFHAEEAETFSENSERVSQYMRDLLRSADVNLADRIVFQKKYYSEKSTEWSSFMFSYIPIEGVTKEGIHYRLGGVDSGYFGHYFYIIAVDNADEDSIKINYLYKPSFISEWNVRELHENALRVIEAGIDNPDITVGELLDMVESKLINHN